MHRNHCSSLNNIVVTAYRWQLPKSENSVSASTANELRPDRHVPVNPEKLKAAAEGLTQSKSHEFLSLYMCMYVCMNWNMYYICTIPFWSVNATIPR